MAVSKNINNVFLKKLSSQLKMADLPEIVDISTMTICCKINSLFNISEINKHIDLSFDGIISCGSDPDTLRTIIKLKKSYGKRKRKNFYNQITLRVMTKEKIINVKLFTNGSIQMTGCKTITSTTQALEILFKKLVAQKTIIDENDEEQIVNFVSEPKYVKTEHIFDIKISMINSNFNIGYKIKREKLFEILISENKKCTYDPIIHACVNIKHITNDDVVYKSTKIRSNIKLLTNDNGKIVSIFVFESGAIIITGAKNCNQINSAFNYINTFLINHFDDVKKIDI